MTDTATPKGWCPHATHDMTADGLSCVRCSTVSREYAITMRCPYQSPARPMSANPGSAPPAQATARQIAEQAAKLAATLALDADTGELNESQARFNRFLPIIQFALTDARREAVEDYIAQLGRTIRQRASQEADQA